MSRLNPGDEDLHHQDGSHRWAGEDGERWRARIEAHVAEHRSGIGSGEADTPTGLLRGRYTLTQDVRLARAVRPPRAIP
jgi:hypothetical protein